VVARGDLGIEIPLEAVLLAQKMIVSKSNLAGKPVICATQMLESMTRSPRPTRAECADTGNAVLDGCDAVMLSGETANGSYPSLCVETMSRICQTAEYSIDNRQTTETIRELTAGQPKLLCDSLVLSAVVAAAEEKAKCMIVMSETGISARLASKYRPQATIIVVTSNQAVARRLQLQYGIRVHAIPKNMDLQEAISSAVKRGYKWGLVSKGDRVVVVHSQGSSMRFVEVPHWIDRPFS
jgi:pyruvate kinase